MKRWVTDISNSDPILKNAVRLLHDSRLLRSARRYPSATALAVLSLEEAGKFLIVNPDMNREYVGRPTKKTSASHKEKQELTARILFDFLGIDQIRSLGEHVDMELQLVPLTEDRIPQNALLPMLDALKSSDMSDMEIRNKAHVFLLTQLLRGEFDSVKQACFYVDQRADGFTEPSISINRDAADASLRLANSALYNIYVSLRRKRKI